jgi:hypothetical protein
VVNTPMYPGGSSLMFCRSCYHLDGLDLRAGLVSGAIACPCIKIPLFLCLDHSLTSFLLLMIVFYVFSLLSSPFFLFIFSSFKFATTLELRVG